MKIKLIKNINEFQGLKTDWDRLFMAVDCSAFQSFEFNYFSWKTELSKNANNQLAISVVKKKQEIIAIFPFYIDAKKQVRFINDIHADFCDCISSKEIDINQLFTHLKVNYSIHSFRLINLKEDSNIKAFLKNKEIANSLLLPFERYSVVDLKHGNFPENYSKFKSKQKTEFRRIHKKNNEKTHHIISADNSDFPLEDILYLKEGMIDLGFREKNFLSKEQLALIENMYNKKHILLSVVKKENKVHALSFVLQKSNEYLFWIDMFDDSKMINIFNYISLMRELSSKGAVKMNLGRGTYSYKITNFNPKIKQLFASFIFETKIQLLVSQISEKIELIAKIMYKKIRK